MSQDNVLKNRAILAQNIKRLRIKGKLGREELSILLGLDSSYISKLEKGKINITIDKLTLISDYFGVNIKYLLTEKPPSRSKKRTSENNSLSSEKENKSRVWGVTFNYVEKLQNALKNLK